MARTGGRFVPLWRGDVEGSVDPVLPDLAVEGTQADAEEFRRHGLVPRRLDEGGADGVPLHLAKGAGGGQWDRPGGRRREVRPRHLGGEVIGADRLPRRDEGRGLQGVSKLADVPGPPAGEQAFERRWGKPLRRKPVLFPDQRKEVVA